MFIRRPRPLDMGVTTALFTGHELRGRGPGEFALHALPDVVSLPQSAAKADRIVGAQSP